MVPQKIKTLFFCQNCGYNSPKWLGRCPSCGEWNQFVEEEVETLSHERQETRTFHEETMPITSITAYEGERLSTGFAEMDRILGGGLVCGSAILVGGDPGIGKSTLLLQIFHKLAERNHKVLYVTGEESARQIKLRALRLGTLAEQLFVTVEITLEAIIEQIQKLLPQAVVVDSIQTVYSPLLSSAPGSVSQVREGAGKLIILAKKLNIPLFLIGHVTKDGSLAGPKVLEHMVDTVLYFEADLGHTYRIIRSIKNRFGPTNEIGVFEMRDRGLMEVPNPSAFFLAERPLGAAGSVVVPSMEGTRPILIEIQSLVSPSYLGVPRRTTIGVDHNRVSLLVAVLDKIAGLSLSNHDVYLNIAGGIRAEEPALDLGIIASLASSFYGVPIDPQTVIFGEVGLTGEVRGISRMEERIKEALRMGFSRCIMPKTSVAGEVFPKGAKVHRVSTIRELMALLFKEKSLRKA